MIFYNKQQQKILEVEVDDNSYRQRTLMGEHRLVLYFSLVEHVEIPTGAYVDYQGERYTLTQSEALKMKHSRLFEYTITMESQLAMAKTWRFRCMYQAEKEQHLTDGRLKFSLTATPREHLQMFVDNMNMRDSGWQIGECLQDVEKCISYNHATCMAALQQMAKEFKTEFEIIGKTVSLHKVEYNTDNPLPLQYGEGKGLKSDITRSPQSELPPIGRVYVQGGNKNIDRSKYGAGELHLPINADIAFDGTFFEGETGFHMPYKVYLTDDKGYCVKSRDSQSTVEGSLDCTEIYPKRIGRIDEVVCVDKDKHFYDFADASIPDNLNYEDYLIKGEKMTVIFQSGMLAGKEFEVRYRHKTRDNNKARRFEIVPQEIDGITMPDEAFKPVPSDTYIVYKCALPDAYINDTKTKQGAEWDMMRKAVKFLYEHEQQNYTFSGTIDGIFAKKKWKDIKDKLCVGGYVLFTDKNIQAHGIRIRITNIKDFINNPYSPYIQLTNAPSGGGIQSAIQGLLSSEVLTEEQHNALVRFTKRRLRTLDVDQVSDIIKAYGKEHFLSKDIADTAKEVITFLKGIIAKAVSYFEGIVNRGDISNNGDIHNTGNITNNGDIHNTGDITNEGAIRTKNLTVTDKATFFELEILKAIAAGGIIIQSAATFKIDDAEETTEGYACYQRAEKDGVKLVQMCEVNDQMMCYGGFNVGVGTNHNVCNHFYWRLVTDAPTQAVRRNINGEEVECLKIVLSRTDCADNSDVPLVGDQTAQVGNRTNTDRQSVIVNSAYKSIDVGLVAPYWAKYVGVNSYDLSKHRETYLAQNDNQIVGNLRARSSSGEIRPVPVLLGEWKSGKEYGYYDSVTHDGRQWLCIVEPGKRTTEEPGKGDAWMMLVDKGSKGDKGESSCTVNIFTDTPNGNIIRNGQGSVWLFAVVYYGTKEITETLKDWQFSWVIHSGNPEFDALWNKRHQQCGSRIELSAQEVNNIAQVECLICDNIELVNS